MVDTCVFIPKAPNGKPSILFDKLLEETNNDRIKAADIYEKIYSKEFKEWFGDFESPSKAQEIYKDVHQQLSLVKELQSLLDVYITGSFAIGKQGQIIRKNDEYLHDLDFLIHEPITVNTEGMNDLQTELMQRAEYAKKPTEDFSFYSIIKGRWPEAIIEKSGFSEAISEGEMKGTIYRTFFITIPGYPRLDFFVSNKPIQGHVKDGIKIVDAKYPFRAKKEMNRPKDQEDFKSYKTFNDNLIIEEDEQKLNIKYYVDNFTDENGEPKIHNINGNAVIVNKDGDIKSVFNQGTFSPQSPNIYHQKISSEDLAPTSIVDQKIEFFKQRFSNAGIEVEVKLDSDLNANGKLEYIEGKPVITLNPNYLAKDTVEHEFGHILIDLLGYDNSTVQSAINSLRGTKLWEDVENAYPELWDNQETLEKEVLATALGKEIIELYPELNEGKPKLWINRLLDALARLFNINRKPMRELAHMLVKGNILRMKERNMSNYVQYQKHKLQELIDRAKEIEKKEDGYYKNGKKLERVTNFISQFTGGFESDKVAVESVQSAIDKRNAGKSLSNKHQRILSNYDREYNKLKVTGETDIETRAKAIVASQLLDEWKFKETAGTSIHKMAELIFKASNKKSNEEIKNEVLNSFGNIDDPQVRENAEKLADRLLEIKAKGKGKIFITEQIVYSEELGLAGTIDLIEYDIQTGKVVLYDFKTKEDFSFFEYEGPKTGNMEGEFSDEKKTDLNKYSLQLSTYKMILKANGLEVSDMRIVPIEADVVGEGGKIKYSNPRLFAPKANSRLSYNSFDRVGNYFKLKDFSSRLEQVKGVYLSNPSEGRKPNPVKKALNDTANFFRDRVKYGLFREQKNISDNKVIEKMLKELTDILERKKSIYNNLGTTQKTNRHINKLLFTIGQALNEQNYLEAIQAVKGFAMGDTSDPDTVEISKMGELRRIQAYLRGEELISHYDKDGKAVIIKANVNREDKMWFYLNALGTIHFYKQLLDMPTDFVVSLSGENESQRESILKELEQMKQGLSYVLTETENEIRNAVVMNFMVMLPEYTSDPKLKQLTLQTVYDMKTGQERVKTDEEYAQDLKKVYDTVFGVQAELLGSQFYLGWAGESNDRFIALMVSRTETLINQAHIEANRKKQEVRQMIQNMDDIEWLFEKDEQGNRTRRFIQEYSYEWLAEYMEMREAYEEAETYEDNKEAYKAYVAWLYKNNKLSASGKQQVKLHQKKYGTASYPTPKKDYFERNHVGGYIPTDKWKNKDFDKIVNTPERQALYEEIQQVMGYSIQYVKDKEDYATALGFLPAIVRDPKSRDIITYFKEEIAPVIKKPGKLLKAPQEKEKKVDLTEFGTVHNVIPFQYVTGDVRDVTEEQMVYDKASFMEAMGRFIEAGYVFRAKAVIEPEILLASDFKRQSEYRRGKVSGEGNIASRQIDRLTGKPVMLSGEDAKAVKQFESWWLTVLYGKDKHELDSKVATRWSNLIMNHMSITSLALNMKAGIADLISGQLGSFIESAAGRHFTSKDWRWAMLQVTDLNVIKDFVSNDGKGFATKEAAVMDLLHILQDTKEQTGTTGANLRATDFTTKFKVLGKKALFIFESSAEWHSQQAILLSILKNKKLYKEDGTEVNVYEALEFNKEKGTVELAKGLRDEYGVLLEGSDATKYLGNIQRYALHVNQKLQGRYTKEQQSELQRYWWGRMLFQFRKHMYPAWQERFGSRGNIITGSDEFFNEALAERDKGRYFAYSALIRDVYNAAKEKNYKLMQEAAIGKTLSEEDKKDMVKNMRELLVVSSIMLLIWAMNQLDDDDEKNGRAYNMTLNVMDRIYSNMASFMPIHPRLTELDTTGLIPEFYRTVKSPVASLQMMHNVYEFMLDVFKAPFVDMTYEGGAYRGENKLFIEGMKLLPIGKEYVNWLYLEQTSAYYKRYQ